MPLHRAPSALKSAWRYRLPNPSTSPEMEIDQLVYQLHGSTGEEIKIVQGK